MKKKTCLIYTRVSTNKQDHQTQRLQLKKYARKKYKIIDIIQETKSTRKKLSTLHDSINRNDYDVFLVWSLDRISRNGLFETINFLKNLADRGIAFDSYSEPLLNTENELVRNILITVLSSLANMERKKISKRTKAGLQRAVAQGKKLGRPPKAVSQNRLNKIRRLRQEGLGYKAIGKQVKIKWPTVQYLIKKHNLDNRPT